MIEKYGRGWIRGTRRGGSRARLAFTILVPLGIAANSLSHWGTQHSAQAQSVLQLPSVYVVQHAYDTAQSGTEYAEPILNQTNVNTTQFGKLFTIPVSDWVDAQVLYVPQLNMQGQRIASNVVFIATTNNVVYAFDADNGTQYWNSPLERAPLSSQTFCNQDGQSTVGTLSTPVIDLGESAMYVVAPTQQTNVNPYLIYKIDLVSGRWAENYISPPSNPATVPGGAPDAINGIVTFNSYFQNQRAALTISGNTVFAAFGSQCDGVPAGGSSTTGPWHGWVMGFDKTSLTRTSVWNSTPNGSYGGIWQAGQGLVHAPDPGNPGTEDLWLATGNGDYGCAGPNFTNCGNYAMSVIQLTTTPFGPNNELSVLGSFTPTNWAALGLGNSMTGADLDMSSNGPTMWGANIVQGGKDGELYSFNYNLMGKSGQGSAQDFQAVPGPQKSELLFNGGVGGYLMASAPTSFTYYVWGINDVVRAFTANGQGTFNTSPTKGTQSTDNAGAGMTLSTNDQQAKTGILWANRYLRTPSKTPPNTLAGTLFAFNADNLTTLWSSSTSTSNPDSVPTTSSWTPPTVALGKVYLPTRSSQVAVYGLHPVFWGRDFGYPQWNPLSGDWAVQDYKGECELGQPVTGLSAYQQKNDAREQAHAVLCSKAIQTTNACVVQHFDGGNVVWDWDYLHYKAQCPANYFVQGVAQNQSGQMDRMLCCPTVNVTLPINQSNCSLETFFRKDSPDYSGTDWDPQYYKGQCADGMVAAGVSSVYSATEGPSAAPHALLCCQPN
jgi:hypothetical protein